MDKVFTVDPNGKAVEHQLQLGDNRGEIVEVLKGLEGTESVVIEGASRLATGVAVKVTERAQKSATDQKVASEK